MFLRQSTSQVVRIGPFLDSTDGVTPETGLTIANTDIDLSKDGGAFASKNSGGATVDGSNGWYSATLDATDTNTVGMLEVEVTVSGALPVWKTYYVVEEAVYDALYAASATGPVLSSELPTNFGDLSITATTGRVDVAAIAGTAQTANDVGNDVNAILVDTNALQSDWANGGRLDLILDATATQTSVDTIDANVDAILVDTGTTIPGTIATVDANVDAILVDTGTTLPATLTTIEGKVDTVDTNVDAVLVDTGTTIPGTIATVDANVDTMVAGIIEGTAATGTLSTTQASTNLTGYADDQLIGRIVTWTSGACEGESTDITDYAETNGVLTFTAMTTTPGNGDTFKIT